MAFAKHRKFMVGASKSRAGYVGLAGVDTTSRGSVTTGVKTLSYVTLKANALYKDGQSLRILWVGSAASNANTKRAYIYLGATAIFDSGAMAPNGVNVILEAWVMRSGSKTQVTLGRGQHGTTMITPSDSTAAENDTADITVAVKAAAATTDADLTGAGLVVEVLTV